MDKLQEEYTQVSLQGPSLPHQMPHQALLHPIQGLLLEITQEHQMPHLVPLGLFQEHLLGIIPQRQMPQLDQLLPIQEHPRVSTQQHRMPHLDLQDLTQELQEVSTLQHLMLLVGLIQELLLDSTQEHLQDHTQQHLLGSIQLHPILQHHLERHHNIQALLVPLALLLLLVVHTLHPVCPILDLLLHIANQVHHLLVLGRLAHGVHKVGSTQHHQICHIQQVRHMHLLVKVLVPYHQCHGELCLQVSGDQAPLFHSLEVLDHTQLLALIPKDTHAPVSVMDLWDQDVIVSSLFNQEMLEEESA
ncbi:MAPK-interacting and spindle-stabilizing protein-like [Xenopus tropicalis]|eukprot:NP_001004952.1 MAPK-interacting and spindle-stabilizing protein-like [Xenopus tropicalis]